MSSVVPFIRKLVGETSPGTGLTDRSSTNTVDRWPLPIRRSSSSKKSTSMRIFEMAFSFIMGIFRPVRKSCAPSVAARSRTESDGIP
jgi:hypothetical protein